MLEDALSVLIELLIKEDESVLILIMLEDALSETIDKANHVIIMS